METILITEKTTLVIGASTNPDRFSNKAINMLREHEVPVLALGLRLGQVLDVKIEKDQDVFLENEIHTITLYLNPNRQEAFYDYILSLRPQRVIFNPGTENRPFAERLRNEGIEALEACTLVMLTLAQF